MKPKTHAAQEHGNSVLGTIWAAEASCERYVLELVARKGGRAVLKERHLRLIRKILEVEVGFRIITIMTRKKRKSETRFCVSQISICAGKRTKSKSTKFPRFANPTYLTHARISFRNTISETNSSHSILRVRMTRVSESQNGPMLPHLPLP